MIFPKRLSKGDKIGIIAPSSPADLPHERIQSGRNYLSQKGFQIIESPLLYSKEVEPKRRAQEITKFFLNNEVRCIMAFWGGNTAIDILANLDFEVIKKNPKIFIGYSDITTLGIAITKKTGLVTFSGPSFVTFTKPDLFEYTWESFEKNLMKGDKKNDLAESKEFADDLFFLESKGAHRTIKKNPGVQILKDGIAEGEIVAGNLESILALHETEYFPDLEGKILFLEEAEETKKDTIINSLSRLAQILESKNANGIVFGRFCPQSGFKNSNEVKDILKKSLAKFNLPILYEADFGHTDPIATIPNGGRCFINSNTRKIEIDCAVL